MEANQPTLAETTAVRQLRLVRFYLPRLLALEGHPPPEWWWYALSLQQLAESVLNPRSTFGQPQPLEHRRALHWLRRAHRSLWSQLALPPDWRELKHEAATWEVVQRLLARALPLVEARLRATLADEERLRMQAPTFSGPVWSMPGLAWRVD